MLRSAIISMLISATLLGSIGIPLSMHTCKMIAAETQEAGCPMCSSRTDNLPVQRATHDGSNCCAETTVHQLIDDGTMLSVEIPSPMLIGIAAFFPLFVPELSSPSRVCSAFGESPPALARRTQHAYLLNSTFLI